MSTKRTPLGRDLEKSLKQALAHARGEIALPSRAVRVPERVDVARLRKRLKLSQRAFAARFGFDVRAVQDWEQGRRRPERTARVLLRIIEREPKAVDRALAAA